MVRPTDSDEIMTTGELSYREEKQVERILFYLTEYDGPQDDPATGQSNGPLYREIRRMAAGYKPAIDRGSFSREDMIALIKGLYVPKVVKAYDAAFPGEMGGRVTPAAKRAAAERIYDELVTMEMESLAESGRRSRRWAPGSVVTMPRETLGHAVEARMNAAAQKAGFLGRR